MSKQLFGKPASLFSVLLFVLSLVFFFLYFSPSATNRSTGVDTYSLLQEKMVYTFQKFELTSLEGEGGIRKGGAHFIASEEGDKGGAGRLLSYQQAVELLIATPSSSSSSTFADQLTTEILNYAENEAVFWEVVPITKQSYSIKPFEFVVLPAPSLTTRLVDSKPFQHQFNNFLHRLHSSTDSTSEMGSTPQVISFLNLGKDATLVVPVPLIDPKTNHWDQTKDLQPFTHLSSFLRAYPLVGRELWRTVGIEMKKTVMNEVDERRPFWLSTSGLGISWLHIRIDIVPKYYNYLPYKTVT